MQKSIFILGVTLLFLVSSCSEQATKAEMASSTVDKQQQKQPAKPVMSNQTGIQVDISSKDAKKGEEACVSFLASDFDNILAYQHSINFDPKKLSFVGSKNYGLPHLSDANFGATKAADGSINFLWYDMNVKGITLADQSKVFDLCFKVLANKGSVCAVEISANPIKMEVVGPQKQKLQLNTKPGKISVR